MPERKSVTLSEMLVGRARPHGPMLEVCPVPGCTTLTMGGTCVAHDPPATATFVRGRPYVPRTTSVRESIAARG
jgi:hypothetical protein